MAQIIRTSGGMEDPSSSEIQTTINDLRGKFVSGRLIYAQEVTQLSGLWNRFNDHYHRADDLYGIDNYGNVTSYGAAGAYDTTNEATYRLQDSGVTNAGDTNISISVGESIAIGKHNDLAIKFNSANGHKHYFDDRTS